MLLPGTEMHWVTFGFVCVELVILFYLLIHRFARPDSRTIGLDISLITLLLVYNITGGLLPDPNLPGSFFVQECIAYATGFITPAYFPYYVYKAFGLEKMEFHARRGVIYFLVLPYFLFVTVFAIRDDLDHAKNILVIPVVYALWVLVTLQKSIRFKYTHSHTSRDVKEEASVLFFSLTPWVGLPFIAYFNLSQSVEATVTNTGFLLLLALHVKQTVEQVRNEHNRLIASETQLLTWNEQLQKEVDKRTKELERIGAEERILQNCHIYRLTGREKEIVLFICRGNSYRQIAESLFIAERTVTKHVQNIFDKVNVSNKLELLNKLGATAVGQPG
ncbi:MAG: helix-turn-helix transcriptional regulator [Chitinophagaceae bacterium]|jgi:DNA-binding CsgD family transcriptional regulator|nr:helix-turn-helix transcriptional regulator [Chitinophagaceae bacterium]